MHKVNLFIRADDGEERIVYVECDLLMEVDNIKSIRCELTNKVFQVLRLEEIL